MCVAMYMRTYLKLFPCGHFLVQIVIVKVLGVWFSVDKGPLEQILRGTESDFSCQYILTLSHLNGTQLAWEAYGLSTAVEGTLNLSRHFSNQSVRTAQLLYIFSTDSCVCMCIDLLLVLWAKVLFVYWSA